jgi:hypothetical protein
MAKIYAKAQKVSDKELAEVVIHRNKFHGEWNYEIHPTKCRITNINCLATPMGINLIEKQQKGGSIQTEKLISKSLANHASRP